MNFLKKIQKYLFYLILVIPSIVIVLFRWVFRFNHRRHTKSYHIQNIAVFQLGHLGDFIHTIPLLRNLKRNFQTATITMIGGEWNQDLAKAYPYIDHYIVFNNWLWDRRGNRSFLRFLFSFFFLIHTINKNKFDLGIELKGHINSIYLLYASNIKMIVGFNYRNHGIFLDEKIPLDQILYEKDRLLSILPCCGAKTVDNHFEFTISENKQKEAEDFLTRTFKNINKPIISLFPGAPYAPKRWPAKKYAALIDKIIENDLGIPIIIGGNADRETIKHVRSFIQNSVVCWIGNDIQLIAAYIEKSNIFIGNDTGPMHIAIALNIPTIAFFSSAIYNRWAPQPPHIVLRSDVSCSPCNLESDVCKFPQINCIDHISVERAFFAMKSMLAEARRERRE